MLLKIFFLAATAEGLAYSMRIPVGLKVKNIENVIGCPENYLLPCYIGIGYPADDKPEVEQIKYKVEQKCILANGNTGIFKCKFLIC